MKKALFLSLLLAGFGLNAWSAEEPRPEPRHLTEVRDLVQRVDLDHTGYNHGVGTVDFSDHASSHTDCSGLMNALLKHCYGYDDTQMKKWLGSARPTARRYHDAITNHVGFEQVLSVRDMRPGDVMAVKYYLKKDDTGHVMIVADLPKKITPTKPLVGDSEQWSVEVIDSSKSGHGVTDTRHAKGKEGRDHDGLGRGIFRLYTDSEGKVTGFAWSTLGASKFMEPKDEHLVIGRYTPDFKP